MNILKKIGGAFKWLGSKTLWVIRRNETVLAVSLGAGARPGGELLKKAVLLVRSIDNKNKSGAEKMAEALEKIQPILKDLGVEITKESELRFILELAIKVMRKQARVINRPGD